MLRRKGQNSRPAEHLALMIDAVSYERDPVSRLWDAGASRLLARAYARPGQWTSTRLALPDARQATWAAARGINLYAPDPGPARTRWNRAFIRSIYYLNTWYVRRDGTTGRRRRMARNPRGIRYQVHREGAAHWRVRVMVVPGGKAGYARIPGPAAYTREPAVRSAVDDRDWQA